MQSNGTNVMLIDMLVHLKQIGFTVDLGGALRKRTCSPLVPMAILGADFSVGQFIFTKTPFQERMKIGKK